MTEELDRSRALAKDVKRDVIKIENTTKVPLDILVIVSESQPKLVSQTENIPVLGGHEDGIYVDKSCNLDIAKLDCQAACNAKLETSLLDKDLEHNAFEVVTAKKNKCRRIKFWAVTYILSIMVMALSLLIFSLTGKADNKESVTAFAVVHCGSIPILTYVLLGAHLMCCGCDRVSTQEISVTHQVESELVIVVLICILTLIMGKTVEVFLYTMAFFTGAISLKQLSAPSVHHDDEYVMKHFWFTIGLGTVTGLLCVIPSLFFLVGWFSIFIMTYIFILRYNFPDKTFVQVFAMVSLFQKLEIFYNSKFVSG